MQVAALNNGTTNDLNNLNNGTTTDPNKTDCAPYRKFTNIIYGKKPGMFWP